MSETGDKILMVHGYNHDPSSEKHSPFRPEGNFTVWSKIFTDHVPIYCAWYSAVTWRDAARAWRAGYRTTYGYAYGDLAPLAARQAIHLVEDFGEGKRVDVVAHSLGTRVILLAIQEAPELFNRVLMLNGAEKNNVAIPIIKNHSNIDFMNIAVYEDDIVKHMGARFEPTIGSFPCIGNGIPPGARRLSNFREIILDDPFDQEYFLYEYWYKIEGDGDGIGDHDFSFMNPDNHELFRAYFQNEL